jgi:hypothetical protein
MLFIATIAKKWLSFYLQYRVVLTINISEKNNTE